ncbi:hypothetical protein [Streptomyces sp. SAS_276]|uniref:hypothetical protein n=1 Tax=Streptomyces sp. SAS_276 TaxID=3412745 RepID=UPI00403CF529
MDSAVANGAGRKVAAASQDTTDTPQGPRVTIHGFPVLAQVAFHHPIPGQNPPAGLQLTSATKEQWARKPISTGNTFPFPHQGKSPDTPDDA